MRFLIVDDEEDIRVLLEMYLRGHGQETTVVADAVAAREACVVGEFDALLLDVSIPVTDGPTILRELRAAGIAPPQVWLLSALPVPQLRELAERLQVAFIAKPFTLTELEESLGPVLRG